MDTTTKQNAKTGSTRELPKPSRVVALRQFCIGEIATLYVKVNGVKKHADREAFMDYLFRDW